METEIKLVLMCALSGGKKAHSCVEIRVFLSLLVDTRGWRTSCAGKRHSELRPSGHFNIQKEPVLRDSGYRIALISLL